MNSTPQSPPPPRTAKPAAADVAFIVILAIAAGYSVVSEWHSLTSAGWETPAMLLVLGGLVAFHAWQKVHHIPSNLRSPQNSGIAWTILLLFFLLACLPLDLGVGWLQSLCLFLFLLAPLCYFSGHRKALLGVLPLFLFCVVLPMHVELLLTLSHPLRLIATMLTGLVLKPFYPDVSYHLTVLRISGAEISITDACSGIEQFEALLLLGYLLVRYQQTKTVWMIAQYAFCVPAVIVANVLRLVVMVVLFHSPVGEDVLQAGWHTGLGYGQVVMAVFIMWGVGELICYASSHPEREEL